MKKSLTNLLVGIMAVFCIGCCHTPHYYHHHNHYRRSAYTRVYHHRPYVRHYHGYHYRYY